MSEYKEEEEDEEEVEAVNWGQRSDQNFEWKKNSWGLWEEDLNLTVDRSPP